MYVIFYNEKKIWNENKTPIPDCFPLFWKTRTNIFLEKYPYAKGQPASLDILFTKS